MYSTNSVIGIMIPPVFRLAEDLKSAIDRPSYRELILERKNLGEGGCGWRNRIKSSEV